MSVLANSAIPSPHRKSETIIPWTDWGWRSMKHIRQLRNVQYNISNHIRQYYMHVHSCITISTGQGKHIYPGWVSGNHDWLACCVLLRKCYFGRWFSVGCIRSLILRFLPRIKQPQSLPLKIVWQNWGAGWFPTCLWWMTARQNSWL